MVGALPGFSTGRGLPVLSVGALLMGFQVRFSSYCENSKLQCLSLTARILECTAKWLHAMSERDEDEEYSESEYSDDKARCFLLRLYLDRRWRTCFNCCNGYGDMPKNVQRISRSFDHFE